MFTRPSWADYGTHDESQFPELWNGCIGAWNPSLGQAGAFYDLSGYGRHFTISDPAIWSSYKGWPVFKDFTNNSFILTSFYNTANPYGLAMSFWTDFASPINNCLFCLAYNADKNTIEALTKTSIFKFGGYDWPVSVNASTMFSTTLNHFVINYQSNLMSIFLNGLLVGGPVAPNTLWATAVCSLGIGRRTWDTPYISTGNNLTGFMFHNRPLSQDEIWLLAQNPVVAYTRKVRNPARIYSFADAAPTPTALPRRPLDGPFYGSLQGSVR